MSKYKFNREQLRFIEDKIGLKGWLLRVFKYLFVSILLALLYYFILSLFYNTEQQRQMARENKLMEQEYDKLQEKLKILNNTVKSLQLKDKEIYRNIFNADPPDLYNTNKEESNFYSQIDTSQNDNISDFIASSLKDLGNEADNIANLLSSIDSNLLKLGDESKNIPSIVPIRDFSIGQTGASVGKKINPFYKTVAEHRGIDLLAGIGTEVLASASGTVVSTTRKEKGGGNTVVINHGNGYVTQYMYLGDILVRQGQRVNQGSVIARVGVSGMSFAPHLHYEVFLNNRVQDPVYYFFSQMSPHRFKDVLTIAANSGQSLD